ncbi:hypothetical protein B0I75DRAFT_148731 [Yarrowia lipolytica]|nr:hypothetical protein LXG23DRAFT_47664 [Yarrowia lipolytica]RDW49738.1 hypothetical protein B0I75DRAFT_148731 [Yarrowia lipolytica]RMJ00456.1 hypothetical protein BD777DRAFT_140049 [Yarrowia lipolytica]
MPLLLPFDHAPQPHVVKVLRFFPVMQVLAFCSHSSQFHLRAAVISLQRLLLWGLVEFHHRATPGGFSAFSYSGSLRLGLALCSGGLAGWAQTLCSVAVFADAYAQAEKAGSGSDRVSAVLFTVIPGVLIPSQQQMEETYDCSNDSPSLQSIQEVLSIQGVAPKGATHTFGELMDVSVIHEGLAKSPTRHHPASS